MSIDISFIKSQSNDKDRLSYLRTFNDENSILIEDVMFILNSFSSDEGRVQAMKYIAVWIIDIDTALFPFVLQCVSSDKAKNTVLSILIFHVGIIKLESVKKIISEFFHEVGKINAIKILLPKMSDKYSCKNIAYILEIFNDMRYIVFKLLKDKINDGNYHEITKLFPKNKNKITECLNTISVNAIQNPTLNTFSFVHNNPIPKPPSPFIFGQNTKSNNFSPVSSTSSGFDFFLNNSPTKNKSTPQNKRKHVEIDGPPTKPENKIKRVKSDNDNLLCIGSVKKLKK